MPTQQLFFFFSFHAINKVLSASSTSLTTETVPSLDSPFGNSFVQLSLSEESLDSLPFSDDYDISCNHFKEMMDFHAKENMVLSKAKMFEIEKATRGQSTNENWKRYRIYRITASNFYSAVVNRVKPSSKLKSMFYSSFSSASTKHGQVYEPHVRSLYADHMVRNGFKDISVKEPALIMSNTHPYHGASLDGIVKHNGNTWGLEMKCLFSKYTSSLSDALADKKFFLTKEDKVDTVGKA